MHLIQTGGIFVEHEGDLNVGIGTIVVDGASAVSHIIKDVDAVVYMSELRLLSEVIKTLTAASASNIEVYSSTPVLVNHLNGNALPQKIEAIKLHNRLEALQEDYDFTIVATWVKSNDNPAQIYARECKRNYLIEKRN